MPDDNHDLLDPAEIASLLSSVDGERAPRRGEPVPAESVEGPAVECLPEGARKYELPSFDETAEERPGETLFSDEQAELELQIEFGRSTLPPDAAPTLREGLIVPLDQLSGDPVDILIEGRLIARGEVLVLNENLCVRVAEIVAQWTAP